MSHGLRATFDREYKVITNDLVEMGKKVEWAIERSVFALVEADTSVAREVIAADDSINHLRHKIEEACVVLIATQQPAASDLRAVIAVMRVVVELERMADHASGISRTVMMIGSDRSIKTFKKISRMANTSLKMLDDVIQAFLARDVSWAKAIAAQDTEMDHMYRSIFERLIAVMVRKSEAVPHATYLMWCAHNLERIADRVTNIAEQTIFLATGVADELNVTGRQEGKDSLIPSVGG